MNVIYFVVVVIIVIILFRLFFRKKFRRKRVDFKKNVIVTGGSRGIGLEIAKLFVADEYVVILVSRSEKGLTKAREEIIAQQKNARVDFIACDLSLEDCHIKLMKQLEEKGYREIFAVVNNAGHGFLGQFADVPLRDHLKIIELNIRTYVKLTHLFLTKMKKRRSGMILNISSTTARFNSFPNMGVYPSTKAFISAFTLGLYNDFRGYKNIHISVHEPPTVITELVKKGNWLDTNYNRWGGPSYKAEDVALSAYKGLMMREPMVKLQLFNCTTKKDYKIKTSHGFMNIYGAFVVNRFFPEKLAYWWTAWMGGSSKRKKS